MKEMILTIILIASPLGFIAFIAWLAHRVLRHDANLFLDARGWRPTAKGQFTKHGVNCSRRKALDWERRHGGVQ